MKTSDIRLTLIAAFLLAVAGAPVRAWEIQDGPLKTRWAADVSPQAPHAEYPRPQMARPRWQSLNGLWNYSITAEAGIPAASGEILVPFPVESALSGVMKRARRVRYSRTFEVPGDWEGRVLLHFGAVDWQATVSLNGHPLGIHKGGYDPFSFDITDALVPGGPQTLVVDVYDPSDAGDQPRGKQVNNPGGIWYTPSTGIWQTVWIEPVPAVSIQRLTAVPDVDAGVLRLTVSPSGAAAGLTVRAVAMDGATAVAEVSGATSAALTLPIPNPRLWSPSHPFLYGLKVSLMSGETVVDSVDSYFGMRKVEVRNVNGVNRILLNGEFIFQVGVLDQGYWPDGLYTAPTDAALEWDIATARALGFNMIRKHAKVEPERWYWHADRLGMLVWQDMPSGDNTTAAGKAQFETELRRMFEARGNHPSIITWVIFNEGWGQYDTQRITALARQWDPFRIIDNPSGWTDMGVGDIYDWHTYPWPNAPSPSGTRASAVGEFGGLGLVTPGHMWGGDAWGYQGLYPSTAALGAAYEKALRQAWGLKNAPGASAVVYTQLTDVETEANGLITYDRAITKLPAARVAAANTGNLLPVFPPAVVLPTAQTTAAPWRYTTSSPPAGWEQPGFDASGWASGPAGFGTQGTPGAIVRTTWNSSNIWLRRTVTLPAEIRSGYRLLMHHDEDAEVYLNGVLAAKVTGYTTGYEEFPIAPAALATLKDGDNVIAIHCRQTVGGQYIDAGLIARPIFGDTDASGAFNLADIVHSLRVWGGLDPAP